MGISLFFLYIDLLYFRVLGWLGRYISIFWGISSYSLIICIFLVAFLYIYRPFKFLCFLKMYNHIFNCFAVVFFSSFYIWILIFFKWVFYWYFLSFYTFFQFCWFLPYKSLLCGLIKFQLYIFLHLFLVILNSYLNNHCLGK